MEGAAMPLLIKAADRADKISAKSDDDDRYGRSRFHEAWDLIHSLVLPAIEQKAVPDAASSQKLHERLLSIALTPAEDCPYGRKDIIEGAWKAISSSGLRGMADYERILQRCYSFDPANEKGPEPSQEFRSFLTAAKAMLLGSEGHDSEALSIWSLAKLNSPVDADRGTGELKREILVQRMLIDVARTAAANDQCLTAAVAQGHTKIGQLVEATQD